MEFSWNFKGDKGDKFEINYIFDTINDIEKLILKMILW